MLKIKDQYECLVKLIEKIESAKYTIKKAVQEIQELDFGEDTCNIKQFIKKNQNNDISEILITLVNSNMLCRKKTITSQCFRCAEPKSAVGFFLSRLEIEISPIYSTYFHSDPGTLKSSLQ